MICIEQWGNRLLDLLVIACKPGPLGVRELGPVYEPCIEGNEGQRIKSQPAFATRVWRHVVVWYDNVEVFKADTTPALPRIARLIGHDHAWLQRLIATAWAYALRPFVHVEEGANAVPSAVAVVETSVPHAGACQPIQYNAAGAFREFLPGQGDVTAQDESVEATLTLRGRADADGTRVVGRSTEYLYTRIY